MASPLVPPSPAMKWGIERNTGAAAGAMFLLSLGENLWIRFVPKYLEVLGAPVIAIGGFGSAEDFLDAVYQYPGGVVGDRLGRRGALVLFIAVAMIGYAIVAAAGSWPMVLVGMAFVMAWSSMASPTLFAVIGDTLPSRRRAFGFSIQSILRRVPIAVAPTVGGLLIAASGVRAGVRLGLLIAMALAFVALLVVLQLRLTRSSAHEPVGIRRLWASLPEQLRRLLLSDIFVRTCEGMVDVFLVIYALNVVGVDPPGFGMLVGVQMITAIACYLPAARLADRFGRKPFVIATFIAFSLFPLAVVAAHDFGGLLVAYTIGGLREMGEPARKALIVDLVPAAYRARGVGLYYFLRSLAITPAALLGGVLWKVTPVLPFLVAGAVGLMGTAVFALTVDERVAG